MKYTLLIALGLAIWLGVFLPGAVASQNCSAGKIDEIKNLMNRDLDQAETVTKQQYDQCADKGTFAFLLAQITGQKGEDGKSYAYLKEVAQDTESGKSQDIDRKLVYYEMSRLALAMGKFSDAVTHLKKLEALEPQYDNVQYLLALAYSYLKQKDVAAQYFELCMKYPNNIYFRPYCYQNLHPALIVASPDDIKAALDRIAVYEKGWQFDDYRDKKFDPLFHSKYASVIKNCRAASNPAGEEPANIIILLNSYGNAEKILIDHHTNTLDCILDTVKLGVFPVPLSDSYYENVDLKSMQ